MQPKDIHTRTQTLTALDVVSKRLSYHVFYMYILLYNKKPGIFIIYLDRGIYITHKYRLYMLQLTKNEY